MVASTVFCPRCGVAIGNARARTCKVCGADVDVAPEEEDSYWEGLVPLPEHPPRLADHGDTIEGYVRATSASELGAVASTWHKADWIM